jgi:hypothetical protein
MRFARGDWAVAAALMVGVFVLTLAASTRQGVHRDESVYMQAGERYAAYWNGAVTGKVKAPFSEKTVAATWSCGEACNSEHPPLMKTLYGLSWRTFKFLSPVTAFRLPTALMFGILAALVYLFFVDAWAVREGPAARVAAGRAAALAAALLTAAQPRAFFHAQTASFDLPAATLWFACAYAYWRALASPRPVRAAVGVGLLYGLFLATKLQSFFLPAALAAHWAYLVVRRAWLLRRERESAPPLPRPWPILAMVTLGPLVFYALWPYLWHHPIAHFGKYWAFHAGHVHYNFEYLGVNYNRPPFPWHEPLVMLVTTAPVVLLALAASGVAILVRTRRPAPGDLHDPRGSRMFLLLMALVPVAPFLTGRAPIFGETKHWLATMPVLAVCAGVALQHLGLRLLEDWKLDGAPRARLVVLAALVGVSVAPAVVETARSHPYGLSHYNALAGGAPGGADLGMNRQFWGYAPEGLFPWMNANLPQGTRIYPHDWANMAFVYQQRDGRLRKDFAATGKEQPGIRSSDVALVVHERHFAKYDYMIWNEYGHLQPSVVLTLDGVPLVSLYERRPR